MEDKLILLSERIDNKLEDILFKYDALNLSYEPKKNTLKKMYDPTKFYDPTQLTCRNFKINGNIVRYIGCQDIRDYQGSRVHFLFSK